MYKKIMSLAVLLSALLLCSSCLNNTDDDYTYNDDSAITAFQLGNVQYVAGQYKATGKDSIVSKDFSSVKFRIDQLGRRIYNVDSLPMQAMASKVLCSASTYNSGMIGLKSATSDTVKYFSSTDTIDFTTPRELIVYSNSGLGFRRYKVEVNVHKQDSAAFVWQQMESLPEKAKEMKGLRLHISGDAMQLVGNDGERTYLFGGKGNASHVCINADYADATGLWRGMVSNGDNSFVLMPDGRIALMSEDWYYEMASPGVSLTALAAASANGVTALDADGKLVRVLAEQRDDHTHAFSWVAEDTDDDTSLFPTKGVGSAKLPLATNSDCMQVIVAGHNQGDTHSSVWSKIEDGDNSQQWMRYTTDDNTKLLPAFDNLQMGAYNGELVAMGHNDGDLTAKFYRSNDRGMTWQADSVVTLPEGFSSNGAIAFTIDSDNFVWLACGGSGQVWRGRQNFLGWEKRQDIYDEKGALLKVKK